MFVEWPWGDPAPVRRATGRVGPALSPAHRMADAPLNAPPERLAPFDRTVALRDGTVVRLRPIRVDDAPRLVALYDHLSNDTRYHRFFSVARRLPIDWARFLASVDYRLRLALVAEAPGDPETLIAVARYEPGATPDAVEVAFVVQDAWQGRGLGTVLFRDLLAAAALNGRRHFSAWVLADNRRMLDLIARLGVITRRAVDGSVIELDFTARPTAA